MAVLVRPVRSADHAAVRALAPRLAKDVARWRDALAVDRAVRGWVDASLRAVSGVSADGPEATRDRALFVADVDGAVAGFVSLGTRTHFTGEVDAYVGELAVASAYEGQGVGRALVAAAETWARERGLRRITLDTGAGNTDARAFYRALDFAEEDVRLTRILE